MRKLMLSVVAGCALVAVAPASALAHGRHHHSRHHARIHHKRFGTDPVSPATPVNTASATLSVVSFNTATNVLTISDANGQQIMGTVTSDTRLICVPTQQPPNTSPMNTAPTGTWQGHDGGGWGGDQNGGGNDQGDDQGQGDDEHQNQCSTADLMANTPVLFADLSLSSNGTSWDKVVLQVAPSTAPSVPDTDNDGD